MGGVAAWAVRADKWLPKNAAGISADVWRGAEVRAGAVKISSLFLGAAFWRNLEHCLSQGAAPILFLTVCASRFIFW